MKLISLSMLLVFGLLFTACDNSDTSLTTGCLVDSDCVPATCCHASQCVLKETAPNCERAMCTMECASGTMDCGGGCKCVKGKCNAIFAIFNGF